jgi:hypothetical protein
LNKNFEMNIKFRFFPNSFLYLKTAVHLKKAGKKRVDFYCSLVLQSDWF